MSSAEINQKKLDLIAWIKELSDVNLLSLLDGLRESQNEKDWWKQITPDQKRLIEQGMEDVKNGRVMSSEEFWNRLRDGKE